MVRNFVTELSESGVSYSSYSSARMYANSTEFIFCFYFFFLFFLTVDISSSFPLCRGLRNDCIAVMK